MTVHHTSREIFSRGCEQKRSSTPYNDLLLDLSFALDSDYLDLPFRFFLHLERKEERTMHCTAKSSILRAGRLKIFDIYVHTGLILYFSFRFRHHKYLPHDVVTTIS
jgi:hypothetical protein